jgi:pyruvate formate lyase activating enzyme
LKFVCTGNVVDPGRQSTSCPGCGTKVVGRDGHRITAYRMTGNRCTSCGQVIPGRFDAAQGRWGRGRMPVQFQSRLDGSAK